MDQHPEIEQRLMRLSLPLWDRGDDLRKEPGLIERLRNDSATRVVVVRDGRVQAIKNRLALTAPQQAAAAVHWALLAVGAGAEVVENPGQPNILLAVMDGHTAESAEAGSWIGARESVSLPDDQAQLMVSALAMAAWLQDAPFCQACGGQTQLISAGWARACLICAREHFPRTDPAVIVAVESEDGNELLLGAHAQWKGEMFSCFAGFVEAGESLEQTIHREVLEEAGVKLHSLRYIGSQAWPYPRSLMVGYRATASNKLPAHADGTEIIEVRWFTRAQIAAALAGDGAVRIPAGASIAHTLILQWYLEGESIK